MEMSSRERSFLSGLRLELPYLVEALAGDYGFFHQPEHFRFLTEVVADHLRHRQPPPESYLVVGCDRGLDAYSLCLTLLDAARLQPFSFSILATDFLPENVSHALRGIYPIQATAALPPGTIRRYFLRNRNPMLEQVRLRPGVRGKVNFRCQDIFEHFALREPMDVIFCRHILHQFHATMARALAERLHAHLAPGGVLFLGAPLRPLPGFRAIGPAIYQRV